MKFINQQPMLLQTILFAIFFPMQLSVLCSQNGDCLTMDYDEPPTENTLCDDYGDMTIDVTIAGNGFEYSSNLTFSNLDNKNVFIAGSFIINSPFSIDGCNVMLRAGSRIIVTYVTDPIEFIDSKFFSCTYMWKGIEIKPNCRFRFSGCEIEDAQYALKAEKSSFLSVENSEFDRNWVGVYMNGQNQTITLSSFSGNEFKHSSDLNEPYSGQSPDPYDRSYVGLWLIDLPLVVFQDWFATSKFSDLNIGILMQNSGFYNFTGETNSPVFENMVDEGIKYNTYQTGVGILTDKGFLNFWGKGKGDLDETVFTGCRYGIYSIYGANLGVYYAKFSNNSIGVLSEQGNYNQVYISDCDFNVINPNRYGVLVRGSVIDIAIVASCTFQINSANAVGVEFLGLYPFFSSQTEPILVEQNEFDISNAIYGVKMENTFFAKVLYNSFNINLSSSTKAVAIYLDDDNFATNPNIWNYRVHGNCINSTGAKWGRGIAALATEKTWITQNTITGHIGNGVDLFEMCPTTRIETNYFEDNYVGLNIGSSATVDPQFHKGNGWENGTFGLYGARNQSPFWQQSKFTVDSNEDSKYFPEERDPEAWFIDATNPGTTPDYNDECSPNVPFSGDTIVQLTALDEAIADGTYATVVSNKLMTWNAELYLYRKLSESPDFIEQDTVYENFYDNKSATNVGAFYEVEQAIGKIFMSVDTSEIALLRQYRKEIDALISDLKDLYENSPTDTSSIYEVSDTLVLKDSLVTDIIGSLSDDIATEAEDILEMNNGLDPDTIYQENEKMVNEIYLQLLISGGVLTDTQLVILNDIASQCPSVGGLSVVKAIDLLPVCDKSQYNNMLDTCYSESQQRAYAPPVGNFIFSDDVSVYPNPAKEVLYVNIGNVEFLVGEIRMIDALGKTVIVYPFTYGNTRLNIPTGSLPEGFYLCSIYLDGRHHKTEKVVVSK